MKKIGKAKILEWLAYLKKNPVRLLLIMVLITDIILCIFLFGGNSNTQPETEREVIKEVLAERKLTESGIQRICELATLDCFYHNSISMYFPGDFTNPGITIYAEYDGNVRIGIDGQQVSVSEPNEENIVTVTIPNAKILSKDMKEDSLGWVGESDGLWGNIPLIGELPIYADVSNLDYDKKVRVLSEAQDEMYSTASKNETLKGLALDRAKSIIEKNIVTLGESAGKHYTVQFVDATAAP